MRLRKSLLDELPYGLKRYGISISLQDLQMFREICGAYGQLLRVRRQLGNPVVEQDDYTSTDQIGCSFSQPLCVLESRQLNQL
jgi:hypothetical protein